MSKPLIYVAGPISKPDPLLNARSAVLLYRKMILDDVCTPICPHLSILVPLVTGQATSDYDFWLRHDYELIDHCAALYRMDGESHGADLEVAYAGDELGIPVFGALDLLYSWARINWYTVAQ